MDNLITFLEDKASDENLPIAIRTAAFNGLKIMKKYYALTDDSILPRCGISKSLYLIRFFAYAYVLLHSSMPLVNDMGNPRVKIYLPGPDPACTRTHRVRVIRVRVNDLGFGGSTGQVHTLGQFQV